MERKLVKQGRNALTITLPAKWLSMRGYKPGDAVNVTERGEDLIVEGGRTRAASATTVDAKGLERSSIWHLISSAYIEGYDTVTILHDNPTAVQEVGQNLIGFVIHEHSATRSVFRSIVAVPEDTVEQLLRRAGHMFVQQTRTVVELARGTRTIQDVKSDERILDNTIIYCMRVLSKYRHDREHELFLWCAWLEMAADMVSMIAAQIEKNDALALRMQKAAEAYVEGIFAHDYKKLYTQLRAFRNSIEKKRFVDGIAFALADMLYNNIGSFVHDPKHQNI